MAMRPQPHGHLPTLGILSLTILGTMGLSLGRETLSSLAALLALEAQNNRVILRGIYGNIM